ncbi:MAG: transcription-repair coupling factor [Pseudomonadales bacterium]
MTYLILPAAPKDLLPKRTGDQLTWRGLTGSSPLLAVSEFRAEIKSAAEVEQPGLTVIVTAEPATTDQWASGLRFFQSATSTTDDIVRFPDWETLPYDAFSPHQDITSERLACLQQLRNDPDGVLIVPAATLVQKIAPTTFLDGACFDLKRGQLFKTEEQRLRLEAAGYQATDTVTERGQYAIRGAVMDIFPMGADLPVRIDLFDDEIDTLRTFDPETQLSVDQINELIILPGKEFPFDDTAVARFRDQWHNAFNVDVRRCSIYQDVSSYIAPNGVEYYLPFFFDEMATLFDYLPTSTLFILEEGVVTAAEQYLDEVNQRYESLRHDVERPILPPNELYLNLEQLKHELAQHRRILLSNAEHKHQCDFSSYSFPDLHANPRLAQPASALKSFLEEQSRSALFVAETAGRREIFDEMLRKAGIDAKPIEHFDDYHTADHSQHCITVGPLNHGLWCSKALIITETEVLGARQTSAPADNKALIDTDQIVRNLTELSIGAPVVHVEHGVGRYLGLDTLDIDGAAHEFLALSYAGGAKLYVPVTSLHLIGRYAGADEEHAPLHRLGSDQWERAKRRAAEKVVDVAAELLDIYARRELKLSHRLAAELDDYEKFAAEFPFEVTNDQQNAIDATLEDLAAQRAMDRLVCGDVGFGKTEVAMRAAFVAAQNNKQVVILVPTTLLAQQHFDTFRDRFAQWPVNIETVSRLRSNSENTEVAKGCANGKVDIVIGTHKVLGSDFAFKDLGLVIIDEEHRFGVRQKERLRALRAEVDVMTLTATPIPRTLNMSLSGIRDLSIIATPPAKRLSIKTFVQQRREPNVREAISRELMRGGQVFFLHNEVRSIEQAAQTLQDLVPEARIGIGHGQMKKLELEQVMNDFYHRRLNVLVCTTIIETGLDIPNANTIIIERADKFGLAQLHQLRGRVGRSHRQAYAYLLTPEPRSLSADAVKRLEAIEAAGDLGVGFTLATHDMEIRGAGELLGDDQSGQIESIGFSLYMEMLNQAVSALQSGQIPDLDSPLEPVSQEVNLHAPTLIPDDYLPDVQARLILYKRIASAKDNNALDALQVEIIDRFGLLPAQLKQLFSVTELKLLAQDLGIVKLDLGQERGKLEFSKTTRVDPLMIVNLVQQESQTYRLEGSSTLRIVCDLERFDQRLAFAHELLTRLTPQQEAAA